MNSLKAISVTTNVSNKRIKVTRPFLHAHPLNSSFVLKSFNQFFQLQMQQLLVKKYSSKECIIEPNQKKYIVITLLFTFVILYLNN
jgi:hypothetical protein